MKWSALLLFAAACGGPASEAPFDAGPDSGVSLADAGCGLFALDQSGSFDIDLRDVNVSGAVTVDGAPASDAGAVFFAADAGTVTLDGGSTYSTRLFAGTYDVGVGKDVLKPQTALLVSGELDLDLHAPPAPITVSGAVTVNGAQPAAGARGKIAIGDVSQDLPASGAATFSLQIAPGAYDVRVVAPSSCTQTSPLPCQPFVWRHALSLSTSGSLAIDLTVVRLSGAVAVNGQHLGSVNGSIFLPDADGNGPTVPIASAAYSAQLYAGAHSIVVVPPQGCTPGPLPCLKRTAAQVQTPVSGSYDIDLPVVTVSGHVTASGAQPPPAAHGATRGALVVSSGEDSARFDLGASGTASYTALLYAGVYEFAVDNATDCPDGAFPCGRDTVESGVQLDASGALDVDVPLARVALTLTANGAAMAASPSGKSRGSVTFHGPTDVVAALPASGAASLSATVYRGTQNIVLSNANDCPDGPVPCDAFRFPARLITSDGPVLLDVPIIEVKGSIDADSGALEFGDVEVPLTEARYAVRLFPGTYEVDWGNSANCDMLPCQDPAPIFASIPLNNSGQLDIVLPVRELSGVVTLDGKPLAAGTKSRGSLKFGSRALDLGTSGPAQYRVKLLRGAYPITVQGDCAVLPCGGTEVRTCQ